MELDTIVCMDALDFLKTLPDCSVNCVVTSPPYFGLRNYNVTGQLGLEATPAEYIAAMVAVFREVYRVLRRDGTLWLNIGDSFANDAKWGGKTGGKHAGGLHGNSGVGRNRKSTGLPPKSLMLIPHRLAIALQDDGWIVRMDNVWHKPDAMPEPVKDRPTKAHEYVFLMTKTGRYWYDKTAVAEKSIRKGDVQKFGGKKYSQVEFAPGDPNYRGGHEQWKRMITTAATRNSRSVWEIATETSDADHYAVMPQALVERCIKAGCPAGGVVLDMFMGSGTVALVARRLNRHYIGCDLNPDYVKLATERLANSDPYQPTTLEDGSKQLSIFSMLPDGSG